MLQRGSLLSLLTRIGNTCAAISAWSLVDASFETWGALVDDLTGFPGTLFSSHEHAAVEHSFSFAVFKDLRTRRGRSGDFGAVGGGGMRDGAVDFSP